MPNFKPGQVWIATNKKLYRILTANYNKTEMYPISVEELHTNMYLTADENGKIYELFAFKGIKLTHLVNPDFGVTKDEQRVATEVLEVCNDLAKKQAESNKSNIIRLSNEIGRKEQVKENFKSRELETYEDRIDNLEDTVASLQASLTKLQAKLLPKQVKVRVQKLVPEAKLFRKHNEDVCFDVFATSKTQHDSYTEYGTGLRFDIPEGYYIKAYPRSSVSTTPQVMANSVAIVDTNYRGELMIRFKTIQGYATQPYKVGDRIAQLEVVKKCFYEFEEVENIDTNTSRGEGGFGSTGKN